MKKQHFAALVFFNLVFAGSMGMTKFGMEYMPPLLFTGVRFFFYAMILVPFLKWHKGRMPMLFAIAMTTGAVSFGLIYVGVNIAGDLSSIVVTLQLGLPFTTIFAMIFLGEEIHWRRWLGMALAFGGVMVISFDPRVFTYINGMMIGLLGALVGSTSTILMRKSKDIDVFQMQAWIAMFSWPVLMLVSLPLEGNPVPLILNADWRAWIAIAFTVFGSNLIAHAGMYWLLQKYEASFIAPFGMMGTLFTVGIGVLFLGDVITFRMGVGSVICLTGVLIISIRTAQSKDTRVQPAPGILPEMEPLSANRLTDDPNTETKSDAENTETPVAKL